MKLGQTKPWIVAGLWKEIFDILKFQNKTLIQLAVAIYTKNKRYPVVNVSGIASLIKDLTFEENPMTAYEEYRKRWKFRIETSKFNAFASGLLNVEQKRVMNEAAVSLISSEIELKELTNQYEVSKRTKMQEIDRYKTRLGI